MLRGSNQSGFSRQVKRLAITAGLGSIVVLGAASLALAQDTQLPGAQVPGAQVPGAQAPGARPTGAATTAPSAQIPSPDAPATAVPSPATPNDPSEAAPHASAAAAAEKAAPAGNNVSPPAPGNISDVEVERQAEALSRSLMSPFCPGRTLSACPSPNAHAWRDDIRKWVREGVSANEIRDRLAKRNPDHNLTGSPPKYARWVLIGVGVLSVLVLFAALRYLLKPPPPPPTTKKDSTAPPGDDRDWDAKLKQELDALEQ
jgi:cytochrome c-type biogenesis protein CcmH/NrfF